MHTSVQMRLPEFSSPATLRRLGLGAHAVAGLVRQGALVRVRRGRYARPDARLALVRAVRLGGLLTSYSALEVHGVWCPPGDGRLHVMVDAHARALRDPDTGDPLAGDRPDLVVHWKGGGAAGGGAGGIGIAGVAGMDDVVGVVPIARAIRHLPVDLDPAYLVAVLDSAVRTHACTSSQLVNELGSVPRLTRALRAMDARAESGTESIIRVRLHEAGIEAELQVRLPPYRVDLVIAGRLVVEVDGREFHDTESAFEDDRRRDAELTRRGYRVLRFSYSQVLFSWPACLDALHAALASL